MRESFVPFKDGEKIFVRIPCRLNRASIGDAEFTFATFPELDLIRLGRVDTSYRGDLGDRMSFGHVPKKDITVLEQPLAGELKALLTVSVVDEDQDNLFVLVVTIGMNEWLVKVPKPVEVFAA